MFKFKLGQTVYIVKTNRTFLITGNIFKEYLTPFSHLVKKEVKYDGVYPEEEEDHFIASYYQDELSESPEPPKNKPVVFEED